MYHPQQKLVGPVAERLLQMVAVALRRKSCRQGNIARKTVVAGCSVQQCQGRGKGGFIAYKFRLPGIKRAGALCRTSKFVHAAYAKLTETVPHLLKLMYAGTLSGRHLGVKVSPAMLLFNLFFGQCQLAGLRPVVNAYYCPCKQCRVFVDEVEFQVSEFVYERGQPPKSLNV